MSRAVKLSDDLFLKAKSQAKVMRRSTAGQIEFWATIGQIAEENPELSYQFIRDILVAKEESKKGDLEDYVFGEGDSH